MKTNVLILIITTALLSGTAAVGGKLEIYIPREISIDDEVVTVGNACILSGDEALVEKAQGVSLGRLAGLNGVVAIDRVTIMSRLASDNIDKAVVDFMGSSKVVVSRKNKTVSGEEVVEFAKKYLIKAGLPKSVCNINERWVPTSITVDNSNANVKLAGSLLESGSDSQARVRVFAYSDGKEIARRDVTFNLKYTCRVAVTTSDVQAGDVLTIENIKVKNSVSDSPEEAGWVAPLGYVIRRSLAEGTVIHSNMLEEVRPDAVVVRNQSVVIKLEQPGLVITAMGKAMEDGRQGELIKVRNADSQRIIIVEVSGDGTVRPVL